MTTLEAETTRNLMSPREMALINRNRELRIRNLTAERDMLAAELIKHQGKPGDRWFYWGLAATTAMITVAIAFDVINKTTGHGDMYYVLGGLAVGLGLAATATFTGKGSAAAMRLTRRS